MPDSAPLEPGDPTSLGQFEVIGRIGAGGQGAVYLGRGTNGDYVAIKLLHAQMNADSSARARFTREVRAAQRVSPFCTARVLAFELEGQTPYVVSEYIDGPPLFDVVAQSGPFSGEALNRLAIGTATALAAVHEAGIIHRDFKPNNVLLAKDGPRVVDFGIARSVDSEKSGVTATGMVVGTPGYLAPEQLSGEALTPAVDIFAWGATMVFAATGHSPFEGDTLPVIINRILNQEPDLSRLAPPLRNLVAAALNKNAQRRPAAHQLLLQLLNSAGVSANTSADRDELLQEGTQLAAKLPTQPPGNRPVTPNPAPQWQMPMQGARPTWQSGPPQPQTRPGPPAMQRPYTPPPAYTPPPSYGTNTGQSRPAKKSNRTPLFIVLACVAVVAIGLGVAAAVGAFSSSSSGVPSTFVGTWSGTVTQPGGQVSSYPFSVTMTAGSYDGTIALLNGCTGTTTETVAQTTSSSLTMHYTLQNTNDGVCLKQGDFTLTPDGPSAVSLHLTAPDTSGLAVTASGTLNKQG